MKNSKIIEYNLSIGLNIPTIDSLSKQNIQDEAIRKEILKYEELVHNYNNIINININILEKLIEEKKLKSVILYHFFFIIELSYKMILLKYQKSDIEEITNFSHNISRLNESINEKINDERIKVVISDIKTQISKIHSDKGKKINYDDYSSFKYNNNKNDVNLIMKNSIGRKEIFALEEAINCIEKIV